MSNSIIEGKAMLEIIESPEDGSLDIALWSVMRNGHFFFIDLDIVFHPVLDGG
jgi:hypothetical protein